MLMLNDEFPEWNIFSPQSSPGSTVTLHLSVENVDAFFERAVAAGCTVAMPLANQFWGARYGIVKDPFGHTWSMATRIENVSPEELEKRTKASFT